MADPVVDTGGAPAPSPTPAPSPAPAPVAAAPSPVPAEPAPKEGYWPADWQKRLAGEDEKELKHVSKYASPEAVWKKARSLEARLSSGELRTSLPKDAKPEEVAAWRKDNGIPEAPDKYDLAGIELDEGTKARAAEFLKAAHEANMTPEQAKAAIKWQQAEAVARTAAQSEQDDRQRTEALDALNEEWGTGFRGNINAVNGFLELFPEGVRDLLKGGRLSDGTGIFNNPDVLRGFVAAALQVNPAATLTPAGGGDPGKTLDEAIATEEKFMRTNRKEYDKDEKRQANLRDLYAAREKLRERKAA